MPDDARLRETIREVLATGPPLRLAVLFGSSAKESARPESDVDIAIVPRDPDLPLASELDLQARLERACHRAVDLVRLDRASTLLRWEAARHGVLLVAGSPHEFSRFVAWAALEYADLVVTLGDGPERFRHRLAERR